MKHLSYPSVFFLTVVFTSVLGACHRQEKNTDQVSFEATTNRIGRPERHLSSNFKGYWYDGTAELTSFSLSQERYGEIHKGHAVQIFVTEDFLPQEQVKTNKTSSDNITVIKYNGIKKFLTGIYPYSIMTSTFNPLLYKAHALKVSHSTQEWCGQAYMQLNNKEQFLISSHSYFEKEADQQYRLPKAWLEDEIWNLIRIDPGELPVGEIKAIPSFEYLRLRHKPVTVYQADAFLKKRDSMSIYSIRYPEIKRELTVHFRSEFPFGIEKWEEITGDSTKGLRTTANRIARIKTAYWQKNTTDDLFLRDSLGLPVLYEVGIEKEVEQKKEP